MIFSRIERTDKTIKRTIESEYAFLDRCAWKSAERVRGLIEGYLSNYPVAERYELGRRIQSGAPHTFSSAIFELFLHECLLSQGFELVPHPNVKNSGARPDFLVTCSGSSFYLEAVLASERGDLDLGSQHRIQSTLDALDDEPHPNFLVFVDYHGVPATQPSSKKLRAEVTRWLNSLNPDCRNHREKMNWSHEGWELEIEAIPLKPDRRGTAVRLLGGHSGEGRWSDGWTGIRDAVKYKAARYGQLDKPLLIAVNYDSVFLDPIDELQALYGQEQIVVSIVDPEAEAKLQRIPNGAWYGPSGPSSRRASGAWIFRGLNQYNVGRCVQTLYPNPWAIHKLPKCIHVFPVHSLEGQIIKEEDGLSIGQALGLESDWPGDD